MARITPPVCRYCRREGVKLYLKGQRCESSKCAIERESAPPGMHSWRRSKASEYGVRLREKQKLKRYYGIMDRQFMKYFYAAASKKGNTGQALLAALERRLDNILFKAGFALSRSHARQLINHGHIYVNDRKVDVVSFSVRRGDVLTVKPVDRSRKIVREAAESVSGRRKPNWLEIDANKLEARVTSLPNREDVELSPLNEQLIVELCSK